MNIRIIINSLIIIFIIHIIILNLNYSYDFGKKKEIEKFSMSFLTDNSDNKLNEEFKKKMLKYIQSDYTPHVENKFEEKNLHQVEASNTFLSNNNNPNFESNVADISKFYNINYDNLNENDLKSTSINNLKNFESLNKNKEKEHMTIDVQSKEPCNVKSYGRESTTLPDTWLYKDELPMNGGKMNGIFGFDSLESQFAIYNPNKLNLQTVNDNDNLKNIPHDDLRKPIIYEN